MKNLKNLIKITGQTLFIIMTLIIGYQIIRAIFEGTWETENIILGAMGIIISGLFMITGFLINQNKQFGILLERTSNLGNSLNKLGNDFKEHSNKFH